MKKRMKNLMALGTALALTLSLTACGGTPVVSYEGSSAAAESTQEVSAESAYREITLSEHLSGGETIWYRIDSYAGKDSAVREIFVLEPDGSLYRADGDKATLGELEQMEDDDISAMVKEAHEKDVLNGYDSLLNAGAGELVYELVGEGLMWEIVYGLAYEFGGEIPEEVLQGFGVPAAAVEPVADFCSKMSALVTESEEGRIVVEVFLQYGVFFERSAERLEMAVAESGVSEMTAQQARALYAESDAMAEAVRTIIRSYEAQPGQYKLSINSDHTGNQTESVTLAYRISTMAGEKSNEFTLYEMTPAGSAATNCGNVVYDSTYGGFGSRSGALYTRIDSSFHFVLEQIGQSGLPIDVDAEDLFQ